MPAKVSLIKPLSLFSKAMGYLEFIPCPLAFWRSGDRVRIINAPMTQLTGYSADELQENVSLWIERIHGDDRAAYTKARGKLWSGESPLSSEYRFFPKGKSQEKSIAETSLVLRNGHAASGIISVYRDISELVELRREANRTDGVPPIRAVIPGFIHEMENHLQLIKGSLDLLRRNYMKPTAVTLAETGVQRTNKLLRELEQFVSWGKGEICLCSPAAILKDLCHCMEQEFRVHSIFVQLECTDSLPEVWANPDEFRKALYTVMDFSRALLPQGGEVKIEARRRDTEADRYIELVVSSRGAVSTSVTEEDVFRPFLKVNGQSIGLSMLLAQRILARQDGKILFEKQTTLAPTFTIVLRANRISSHAS